MVDQPPYQPQPGSYPPGPYQPGAQQPQHPPAQYPPAAYQQNPYQQAPYQQGPGRQAAYQQAPYQQGPGEPAAYQQNPNQPAQYQPQGQPGQTPPPTPPPGSPPAAPEPRRPRKPVRQRVGTAALLIAALAVGGAISNLEPDPDVMHRPFLTAGAKGETVQTRSFDAVLLEVRGGQSVGSRGVRHDSKGVWIIAKVRLTARGETTTVSWAAIRDGDERVFEASGRVQQTLGGRDLQPGIPVEMEVVFEVPTNVPMPLAIRLATNISDHRMDGMAEIDLAVTSSDLATWAQQKDPLTIMRAKLAGGTSS
ncbi:MAG: hypothetical protein HOV79_18445 [Hamadaea sp.]|nr:hypothetical protein [Hamadaea sp.]